MRKARKEAREESEESLKVQCQKNKSWEWTAKNENASFSSNKEKLERMDLMWQKVFLDTFAKEISREW